MIISELSPSHIKINDPREVDAQYVFDLDCSGMPLAFSLSHTVEVNNIEYDTLHLSVQNKSDVLHLHQIYSHIFSIVFTRQNEWFENNFEEKDLNDMFKPFLAPNYKNNCIDLICTKFSEHAMNNVNGNIIPLIVLRSLIFDGSEFHIDVELKEFQEIVETNTQPLVPLNENNDVVESDISGIENVGTQDNLGLVDENNNHENDLEDENQDNESEDGSIESVVIDEDNIEKLNMKINDEDFYLLFRLVQSKIHENMALSLRDIMENKNIKNIDEIDVNELLYEINDISDDESSDSVLNDDDEKLETNMSKIMSE